MPSCTLLFGGTFDPPHRAHVALPPIVAQRLGCDRILYIPAAANPLKDRPASDAEHRLAMLHLALAEVQQASICTIELERPGPSYTVDTLEELHSRAGDEPVHFRLLMGADAALSFPRWRRPHRILELAEPAVMLRPPWDMHSWRADLAGVYGEAELEQWLRWTVPVPAIDVSASKLRERLAEGGELDTYLPQRVAAYIREHGLYGARGRAAQTRRSSKRPPRT